MTALTTRLHSSNDFVSASRARSCNCGVCVMTTISVFEAMEFPGFRAFADAYPGTMYSPRRCLKYWQELSPEQKKAAIFYIDYAVRFKAQRNSSMFCPETWLITKWWEGIPAVIRRKMESEIASPSIVPLSAIEMPQHSER